MKAKKPEDFQEFDAELYAISKRHGATDQQEPEEPETLEDEIRAQGKEIQDIQNTVNLLSL